MKFLKNSRSPLLVFWVLFALLSSAAAWSFIFDLDKSIILKGSIRPLNASFDVQTISGGRVVSFDLKVGQLLEKGQVIAEFDYSDQIQKAAEIEKRISSLTVVRDRLLAALEGSAKFKKKDEYQEENYNVQFRIHTAQMEAKKREESSLEIQIKSLTDRVSSLMVGIESLEKGISLAEKKVKLYEALFQKGYEGEIAYLSVLGELDAARERKRTANDEIFELISEINLLNHQKIQIDTTFTNNIANELFRANSEIEQLNSELSVLTVQALKQRLLATESGRITKVNIDSEGQVVEPGFSLVEYVPLGAEMAFAFEVSPQYINDLRIDQEGQISLSNMDTRSGDKLLGSILEIEGDITQNEAGERYYAGNAIIYNQKSPYLIPGVDGTISINVGKRKVADYFLEPIFEALSTTMREK